MRLRNKKTGEIGKLHCDMNVSHAKYGVFEDTDIRGHYWEYDSLAELNAEWEDYGPKEPLIKDEKIRKAVRAWAEANNIKAVYYYPEGDGFYVNNFDDEIVASIHFGDKPIEDGYGDQYTIDELCGEEEE